MNDRVADLIRNYPEVTVLGSGGGSMMIADQDDMAADQSFIIEGDPVRIRNLALAIEAVIERPVGITER